MTTKKIIATIEARMTSRRLPGKVLKEACGKPLLQLQVERLQRVKALHEIVIATTTNDTDDPVVALAKRMGVKYFRGSEEDVLKRVLEAARSVGGEILVETTGDCPLLDPNITSQIISLFQRNECDYASNLDPVSFPIGFDSQVFPVELLALTEKESELPADREHVSWFIRRQPERFRKIHLPAPQELQWPDLGLTVDEESDYRLIKKIFEHFYPTNPIFSSYDIVRYLRANPALLDINKSVARTKVAS